MAANGGHVVTEQQDAAAVRFARAAQMLHRPRPARCFAQHLRGLPAPPARIGHAPLLLLDEARGDL
eukprot:9422985-Lingulodinium_polyedra.AAC.1